MKKILFFLLVLFPININAAEVLNNYVVMDIDSGRVFKQLSKDERITFMFLGNSSSFLLPWLSSIYGKSQSRDCNFMLSSTWFNASIIKIIGSLQVGFQNSMMWFMVLSVGKNCSLSLQERIKVSHGFLKRYVRTCGR